MGTMCLQALPLLLDVPPALVAAMPLQIEWNIPDDPAKGFRYIWLSEVDYQAVTSHTRNPIIKAHAISTESGALPSCCVRLIC